MQAMNIKNFIKTEFITKKDTQNQNQNYVLLKKLIEEENKFDPKYKTELCKKFQNTGQCPYGYKCRFAHGEEELVKKSKGLNYKKKPCKTFKEKGYCPYGYRCSFRHNEMTFEETSFSYFYLQLALFKRYNFLPSRKSFYSSRSNLLNDRLPVFKSFTKYFSNEFNPFDNINDKFYLEIQDRNISFSTISNTSNEDSDHKKYSQNGFFFEGIFRNDEELNVK